MATKFSQLYKQELKSQGILSSLGSAALKKTKERMDIRNTLFGGSGVMSLTGQKIFGKGYSGSALSSSPTSTSSVADSQGISELLASNDRQESLLRVIGKNTFNMNMMARDANITRQNIVTLTKKMTGRASRSQDALWYDSKSRNKALDFKKDNKSPTSTSESSSMIGSIASGILGVGGSMLSGIAGIAGTIGSGVLGAVGAIARISPILGIIGLSATAYVIKKLSEQVDFSSIADSLAKTLGIDLKSDKSILQQFAEKLDTTFNTTAFSETFTWAKEAFSPAIDIVAKKISIVGDVALVYTKAAFQTLADGFSNLGKVFGFLFNEFFESNKGKIFAAISLGIMGPKALSLKGAAIAGLAGAFGSATGEESRDELDTKVKEKESRIFELEDLARRQGGPNGQPYLNPQQSEELKFNQRELERLKSKKGIKDTEYEKLLGNVSNTTDNFSKYVNDYKNSLPGGKYGGESTSSNTNAPLRISSDFGMRAHPMTGLQTKHEGVDIPLKEGTDIVAVERGKVTSARNSSSYGNVIEIDHGNGRTTKYAHLKSMQVAVGDMIEKGQKIGLSGNTGSSSNPHLHFEELERGIAKKPSQELAFSAIRGQMLNDGSRALADASRPDNSPANINVVNQQTAAPPQQSKPQNAVASAHNFDPWVEIWSASILNPARMGM